MHPSTAIAFLASFATASVLPRQDTASPGFKLQSRLANGTSMGYFSPTVGGGAWFGVLVDDISEARSLVLTDSNPQKANLMVPKDESDGRYWDIAWVIGGFESDQQELVALTREEDHAWTVGFSIDSDKDNLLSYDGPLSPLLFGACRNIGLYRGSGPQTALYWKIPGAKHARTEACADLSLHAIFD